MNNDYPWLKSYPKGIPATIDLQQYASIAAVLEGACDRFRHRPAFANMGTTLSYDEIDRLSAHFASYLLNTLKLNKGDRVAIMLPNLLQYPIAIFGILRAGLIVVNTNPMYTPRVLKHQLNDSGAVAIVVLDIFAATVAEVISETSCTHVFTTSVGDLLRFPKSILTNFVLKYIKRRVPNYRITGAARFMRALRLGARDRMPKVSISPDDVAFLQYTGGTTGVAKGAMLTHRNLVANMQQC